MPDLEAREQAASEIEVTEPQQRLLVPWVAGLLGLLAVGLGQMYTGRLRAAVWWVAVFLATCVILGIAIAPTGFAGLVVFAAAVLGVRLAVLIEAIRFAARNRVVPRQRYNRIGYYLLALLAVSALMQGGVRVIRGFGIEAFRMPTGSMESTLLVGDFLIVDRRPGYEPRAGDVVVFSYPLDPRLHYIKRCVAGPGQTVEIRDGALWVDGHPAPEPATVTFAGAQRLPAGQRERSIFAPEGAAWNRDHYGPLTVRPGHYFMLGDNRDNSVDSRYWGFLDGRRIKGRASCIYLSIDKRAPLSSMIRWSRIGRRIE